MFKNGMMCGYPKIAENRGPGYTQEIGSLCKMRQQFDGPRSERTTVVRGVQEHVDVDRAAHLLRARVRLLVSSRAAWTASLSDKSTRAFMG